MAKVNKKAQATIFMIIGLIVLIGAFFIFFAQRLEVEDPVKITDVEETVDCENDETFQCDDGSIIVVRACLNNIFIKTGEVCKVVDSCNEDVTEVCGDGSIITTSRCVNGVLEKTSEVCKQEKTGDQALTTFETLEKVEQIAPQNSQEAEDLCTALNLQVSRDLCFNKLGEVLGDKSYCDRIVDERTKDVCLSNVAKFTDNSLICEEIDKDSRRDSCYMNFVIDKKDYTVCDKVTNQYLSQSCESLRQLSKLNITGVSFYESLINQTFFDLI